MSRTGRRRSSGLLWVSGARGRSFLGSHLKPGNGVGGWPKKTWKISFGEAGGGGTDELFSVLSRADVLALPLSHPAQQSQGVLFVFIKCPH